MEFVEVVFVCVVAFVCVDGMHMRYACVVCVCGYICMCKCVYFYMRVYIV